MGQECGDLRADLRGNQHRAVPDGQRDALGHALHRRFLQSDDAVAHARQTSEQSPEAQGQRARDDAERLRARPARRAPFPPQGFAFAQEPAPARIAGDTPPRIAAARGRAEQDHPAGRDPRFPL